MTSRDDLRIGDAERDAAMTALREHYAQGRLTHQELDERLELTLSARTGRDLALVSADLPELPGSRPKGDGAAHGQGWTPPHPAAWHRHGMGRRGGPPIILLVFLAVAAAAAITGFGMLKFVFLAWLVVGMMGMLHRRRWHHRGQWHHRRYRR
ncbi:DUF1707 domain-containing protein [Streptosporangium sp. NPDC087985]|uniref:DUF1707 SHOCT-like domain-containing protein n=1 Tax=Streptosporangium sp. NPDC087985 TaxID=3366196 RepID=UPI0038132122